MGTDCKRIQDRKGERHWPDGQPRAKMPLFPIEIDMELTRTTNEDSSMSLSYLPPEGDTESSLDGLQDVERLEGLSVR